VRVDVHRDLDSLVAEALLNNLHENAVLKGKGSARVPESVKLDAADARLLDEPVELPLGDVHVL